MFYWLDIFTQCLLPFFHQGMGSNPTSCTVFNILWAGLTQSTSRRGRLARLPVRCDGLQQYLKGK
jgi:hypothetical protein